MDDKILTICLECGEVMPSREYACKWCCSDSIKQQNIGWLFPENLARFGMELPEIREEEVEPLEESPELERKKENE